MERHTPPIEVQIGGKYGPDNPPLYAFKKQLQKAGIEVLFPKGDAVLEQAHGFAITHESEKRKPFDAAEMNFLRALKKNPIHIICNVYEDAKGQIHEGYMGEAASIEAAYALAHNKPLVLVRPPEFAKTAPEAIRKLIEEKRSQVTIQRLDDLDPDKLLAFLDEEKKKRVDYGLTEDEKAMVMKQILNLARSYRKDWKKFKESSP